MAHPPHEEQTLPRYYERRYYPAKIGQIVHDRYRILAKLGYGASSTVWLARDQRTDQYKTLKIYVRNMFEPSPGETSPATTSSVTNEISILRHISTCSHEHAGATVARLADDIFDVEGHDCMVTKPYDCSLQQLQQLHLTTPPKFIAAVVTRLLACINWLQLDCGVVHTEITPQNIVLAADGDDVFETAEQEEVDIPSVPFVDATHPYPHPIYASRGLPLEGATAHSVLADFGSARLLQAGETARGWWMPDTYRAPEILMGLPWGHPVDIWSIGVLAHYLQVLELLEGKNVFDPIDHVHSQYVLPLALAQYIAYMGPPPLWMIQQSSNPVIATFFDAQGRWIADPPIQSQNARFEDLVTVVPPGEEGTRLLNFLRKTFTWDPMERATASELFEDEWLTTPFKALGILP